MKILENLNKKIALIILGIIIINKQLSDTNDMPNQNILAEMKAILLLT